MQEPLSNCRIASFIPSPLLRPVDERQVNGVVIRGYDHGGCQQADRRRGRDDLGGQGSRGLIPVADVVQAVHDYSGAAP